VPEIASRKHIENIGGVIDLALDKISLKDIDAIAVTCGPGLAGALLVGVAYAKGLAYSLDKPLIGVHHIEGHIIANFIDNHGLEPEFISLVVSGGHTHLVRVRDYGEYEILGRTRDDAAGEAFDKIARALGLGYPGGPAIDDAAKSGDSGAISFPRVLLEPGSLDFSFSGLKSAVLNYLNTNKMNGTEYRDCDVAAAFQASVVETLTVKAISACNKKGCKKLAIAGGVAVNGELRRVLSAVCADEKIEFFVPEPVFCTDNAAMIASCGFYDFAEKRFAGLDLNARPSGSGMGNYF
jgi:N6-L-threonylcarbamoyladenine synthase